MIIGPPSFTCTSREISMSGAKVSNAPKIAQTIHNAR
jgi:hypothetical protein